MQIDLTSLPKNSKVLQRLVTDMATGLSQRDEEIDRLQQIIKGLQRSQYGRRSEQLDTDQMALSLNLGLDPALEEGAELVIDEPDLPTPPATDNPGTERSRGLPDHLPRTDVVLEPEYDG